MSYDQLIHFAAGDKPTKDELYEIIAQYFGAFADFAVSSGTRWTVQLRGSTSIPWPNKMLDSDIPKPPTLVRHRFIEVYYGDPDEAVDVITRDQDEATMALATGLTDVIARFWHGRIERG